MFKIKKGSIGVGELEDPLISLGIAESRAEVERIVADVDKDGSKQIEFDEFLAIIKSKNTDKSSSGSQKNSSAIVDFFKGKKNIDFLLIVVIFFK